MKVNVKVKYSLLLLVAVTFMVLHGMVRTAESAGLAESAWPCKGHDSRRTGRSPYIGAQNDHLKWTCTTHGSIFKSSPAIGIDGTIYIGSYKAFCAINKDGSLKWQYVTKDWIHSSPAIGDDGTIYVGSLENVYAFYPNGTLKWKYQALGWVDSSPAIGIDGTIYIGSADSYNALNPDGSLKWSYKIGGGKESSPAIGDDDTIYAGNGNGNIYAFYSNGNLKWIYPTGKGIESSPAIGIYGTVYVGNNDGKIYAINPDGSLKWIYQTGNMVHSSPAIGDDGTIYIGSDDFYVYALNPEDGSLKWNFRTEYWVESSPIVGADGTIYVGSIDGNLYALNSDGSLKWSCKISNGPDCGIRSSPAISNNGTVYIGTYGDGGIIYAFGEEPTLIELDQFTAVYQYSQITLTWNTLSEIDNAGFNLWRRSENGPYIKINSAMIEAEGGATLGAEYSFIDDTAISGVTYSYKIEDIDTNGNNTFHGPVSATIPAINLYHSYFKYPWYWWSYNW